MSKHELKRDLGLAAAAAIVVGTTIGSGIFLVPKAMVLAVGTPWMVFAVWVAGGILSLFGALTYAELSSAMPEAGGEYVYLNAAYGPLWAFIYGWTQTWVAKAASIATLATGFYLYLANFLPVLEQVVFTIPLPIGPGGNPLQIRYGQLLGIAIVLFLSGVNYVGVKVGGNVQIFLTVLKVALIFGVIVVGLMSGQGNTAHFQTSTPAPGGFSGFFAALVAALWAYDGWNNSSMVGSEIRNPEKNLPRALIFGTLLIIAVYLLTNLAYFYVLSAGEVAASDRVASEMMRKAIGPSGAAVVSIAAMMSIFAALNGSILSGARVPFAMARDGYFFGPMARVHPQFQTPAAAILLLGGWSCLVLLSGQYDNLYTMVIFSSWILYGMTGAAAIVLRRKRPDMPRPYRVWGYPVVPLLFCFVAALLLYSTLIKSPRESLLGLAVIVVGLPFYLRWSKKVRSGAFPPA
jgi:APA family basic amino acid/polyamine antiporter